MVDVELRGMGGGAVFDIDDAGEVADVERGVSEISVDIDVADVAGGSVIGDPFDHAGPFWGVRCRLFKRVRLR